jgi:hypothetical protein
MEKSSMLYFYSFKFFILFLPFIILFLMLIIPGYAIIWFVNLFGEHINYSILHASGIAIALSIIGSFFTRD